MMQIVLVQCIQKQGNNQNNVSMMQIPTAQFKQQLVHLRSDFMMYLKQHKTKGIPLQHLVILLQKYIKIQPSSLETLLSRTISNNEVTWQHLLVYMEQEIGLEDEVNKMRVTKPSIIDIHYFSHPDEQLKQNINHIQMYIKKKSTNYIKFIKKAQFLGFKLLVVALERQAIFYDCEDKCIIRHVQFKYNNVRSKILNNLHMRQKNYDQYNQSFLRLQNRPMNSQQGRMHTNKREQDEQVDKVPPMSRRTQEHPHSFSLKSHKNTNQSEQLRNMISNNMKVSKVGSSVSGDDESNYDNIKRSVTMMDSSMRNSLHRDVTKVHKFGQLNNNSIRLKDQRNKKELLKVRSGDTASILKLITDSKVEGSIEVIKAYRNSIETFQKYVQIDKTKIEKQKQLFEQYKLPSAINMKFDYKKQIKKMKDTSKQLSLKKNSNTENSQSSVRSSYKNYSKARVKTQTSPSHHQQQHLSTIGDEEKLDPSNAFVGLQKKILQIQSISFCDNYMLVSLMNCQLRLYSFKRTIHGFSEQLVFEKSYHSLVTDVLIYKSSVRKLYNICVILSKIHNTNQVNTNPNTNTNPSHHEEKQKEQDIRNIQVGLPKHKQTQILVYELSQSMHIQKQAYMTYLPYSPIICNILPLGVGGYLESGNFFVIQLNCTSTPKSEIKSIDTVITNPEQGQRVSLSCMKVHRDLVNFFIGSKDGEVYVYDKLIANVRIHKKISNCQIVQLMFVSDWKEVMFWDVSGKVGIFNANNLGISSVVSLMGPIARGVGGNNNGGGYWAMISYFLQNEFLVYGDRTIGLVSLFENHQKKFHAQKSIKIYNRRLAIKNRNKTNKSQNSILAQSTQTSKLSLGKKIHKYFSIPNGFIIISSAGEIMVHDKCSTYIGSYFTLNYGTVTQAICCPALKYLYLLHQNNDMQVVNIYTQEQVLFLINIKEEVFDIFFCHSSVYFCGYLTSSRFQLQLYGFGTGRASDSGYVGPLISVNMCAIILDLPPILQNKDKDRDSKFSKISKISLSSNSASVDMDVKFYKGSMILIKKQTCEVIFLYKKTYTRNCVIKCLEYTNKYAHQQFEGINISHSFVDLQASLLTLILSHSVVLLINLDGKTVRAVYKLSCAGSPIEHYYQTSSRLLSVLSKKGEDAYQYSLHRIQQSSSTTILLYSVDQEPYETFQQGKAAQMINESKMRKIQKEQSGTNLKIGTKKWVSAPFLVGNDFSTLSHDQNYFNLYKITAGDQVLGKTTEAGKYSVEHSRIEVE